MTLQQSRARSLARVWDKRVNSWQQHVFSAPGFQHIRAQLIAAAAPTGRDVVVDLGAGTGFLTFPIAELGAEVTAVDVSPKMLAELAQSTAQRPTLNISSVTADLATFDLPPASVDVVVSCYALHHLTDRDKIRLLNRARVWLRPGGRLVIADMMLGRGTSREDWTIAQHKIAALVLRGPAGWWRILKNVVRLGLRVGSERPASTTFWAQQAASAGFVNVETHRLIAEAGLLTASVSPTAHALGEPASPRELATQTQTHARTRGVHTPV